MINAITTIRTALQIYGAMNRHEYDLVDALRERCTVKPRFHRAVTAVQATIGGPAVLILARSAREREKSAMAKAKEMPRWTVRNALRLFGDRYSEAIGIAKVIVGKVTGGANDRNRQSLRKALRFYGNLWRAQAFAAA